VSAPPGSPSALGRARRLPGHGDEDEENQEDNLRHFFRRLVEALERACRSRRHRSCSCRMSYFAFRGANRRLRRRKKRTPTT
jgi:hypothetical protein